MEDQVLAEPAFIIPERSKDVKAFFDKESETSDAILRAEGESLYVNKAVIALASKELASMFTHPDGATTWKMEAILEEKKYSDVLDMMTFIYPNFEVFIDETNLESLMTLAKENALEVLLKKCSVVMERVLTQYSKEDLNQNELEKILRYLKQTDKFCLESLRQRCMSIMCRQFYMRTGISFLFQENNTIERGFGMTSVFKTLPESFQQELILKRLMYVEKQQEGY